MNHWLNWSTEAAMLVFQRCGLSALIRLAIMSPFVHRYWVSGCRGYCLGGLTPGRSAASGALCRFELTKLGVPAPLVGCSGLLGRMNRPEGDSARGPHSRVVEAPDDCLVTGRAHAMSQSRKRRTLKQTQYLDGLLDLYPAARGEPDSFALGAHGKETVPLRVRRFEQRDRGAQFLDNGSDAELNAAGAVPCDSHRQQTPAVRGVTSEPEPHGRSALAQPLNHGVIDLARRDIGQEVPQRPPANARGVKRLTPLASAKASQPSLNSASRSSMSIR